MSTIKTINFTNPSQNAFAYNTDEVTIDTTGAFLKKRELESDELLLATGRVTQNSDLGASLPVYKVGAEAVWDTVNQYDLSDPTPNNYFSLNDDSGRDGVTPLSPTSHFDFGNTGTVRLKYKPNYNNGPPQGVYIFSTGDSTQGNNKGLGSLISLSHLSTGAMQLRTYNQNGGGQISINTPDFLVINGQEYEIEFNYNSSAVEVNGLPSGKFRLFINGVLFHQGNVRIDTFTRDYFYIGNYYTPLGFASQASFSDIQIFNTVKHSESFADEVPRVANLYPLTSIVNPSEISSAEGFISADAVTTLESDSSVRYFLKIEDTLHWINSSGDILVSNESLSQTNNLARLNNFTAEITQFIEDGARVSIVPILSSGPFGVSLPLISSTTLTYDFFTVPVSCETCTLYGFIKDNCDPLSVATVRVYTKKPILTQGNLISIDETTTVDPTEGGSFEIRLVIPNYKTTGSSPVPNGREDLYIYEANWTDLEGKPQSVKYKILIPNKATVILREAKDLADAL
jgi:hypothetical protein